MITATKQFTKNIFLSQYIHSYTYINGTLFECDSKFLTRAFPTIMTQLLFEFSGEVNQIVIDKTLYPIKKGTYVKCGLCSWADIYRTASEKKSRNEKFFQIILFPHTLYDVFNISPIEILDSMDIKVEDIFGKSLTSLLYDELESCDNGEDMIDVFEKYFLNIIMKKRRNLKSDFTSLLLHGFQFQSIRDLSQEIRYSPRWIQKQYLEKIGANFKQIQNNIRFLKSLEKIHFLYFSNQPIHLASIAYHFGYYDQPHFNKGFLKYSGMTPLEYINYLLRDTIQYEINATDLTSSLTNKDFTRPLENVVINLKLDVF